MTVTPIQAASYYGHYHALRRQYSRDVLHDVYGFLVSDTKPVDTSHPYFRFIRLEESFVDTLQTFKQIWTTGIPFVKNLLETELGISASINEQFYELLTNAKEE